MSGLVGSPAPDFELPDQSGRLVQLRSFRGSPLVLFFYPKDDTSVCTREACAFRDSLLQFGRAQVLGVSSDSVESHRRFAEKFSLPYPLLSDSGGQVRRLFRVKRTFGILPGRATFVIDAEGIVRHAFSSPFVAARHVAEALGALNSSDREKPPQSPPGPPRQAG